MNKKLTNKAAEEDDQNEKKLAVACSFLNELSDAEFESLVSSKSTVPPEYEQAMRDNQSRPIEERIAEWKQEASASAAQPTLPKVGLVKRLRDALCPFTNLLPLKPAMAVEFCSDPDVEPPEQRTMNLCEWFEENELNLKLPWASPAVTIMKSPIKDKPGMVRYRAMVEKRDGGNDGGALCIALQAGEHRDKVRLEHNRRSKTFLKTVLPTNAPVSFVPTLE